MRRRVRNVCVCVCVRACACVRACVRACNVLGRLQEQEERETDRDGQTDREKMFEKLSTEVQRDAMHAQEEDDYIARGMHVAHAVGARWGRLRT